MEIKTMSPLNSFSLEESIANIPKPVIEGDAADLREKFNRAPFMFTHHLGDHPLFEIPRLVQLASTILQSEKEVHRQPVLSPDDLIPFGGVFIGSGKVKAQMKWGDMIAKEKEDLLEQMSNIQNSDSWLLLYSVQRDPEYRALLHQVVDEIEELTGMPLRKDITTLDAYIFVASPHSITPYHIDHESTFLFQIHGERNANLFNQYENSVLSDQELEEFYVGNLSAANYKEEYQSKAYVFPLTSGKGVHHPIRAPHWYKNGNSHSVALGIHFGMRSFDLPARVYQVNYYLRKLGLNPTPPGKSALLDSIKIHTIGLFSKRKPETKIEVLRSGIDRISSLVTWIAAPIKFGKKMLKRPMEKMKKQ
jgi:hypothetical protein